MTKALLPWYRELSTQNLGEHDGSHYGLLISLGEQLTLHGTLPACQMKAKVSRGCRTSCGSRHQPCQRSFLGEWRIMNGKDWLHVSISSSPTLHGNREISRQKNHKALFRSCTRFINCIGGSGAHFWGMIFGCASSSIVIYDVESYFCEQESSLASDHLSMII